MAALANDGQVIDPVSVITKLRDKRCLTRVGGSVGITSMMDGLFDVTNITHYAKGIERASNGRELKQIGRRLSDDDTSPDRRMDAALSSLADLNSRSSRIKDVSIGDATSQIMASINEGNGFGHGVMTGFGELDEPLNGLMPSDYIILGAQPSVGKSAISLQIASNAAKKNHNVFYFSPEMTQFQLGMRLLSMESGVPYESIVKEDRNLTIDDHERLDRANKAIKEMPLHIDDSPVQGVSAIRLAARSKMLKGGLDLIIVDYLQLLCPEDDDKSAVTIVSKGLKAIAKDLEIPVLACSQLRRPYGKEPRRPDKFRLKGSGQLEADADSVILMWHPVIENKSKVEVFIDKNRNGPLGQTTLHFDKDTTRFSVEEW